MTTLSASEARKQPYNLVDRVKETHMPVQIVGKSGGSRFRLVYQVLDDIKTVKVIRMWTHYE